jgi:hypothetical protein
MGTTKKEMGKNYKDQGMSILSQKTLMFQVAGHAFGLFIQAQLD